MNHTIKLTVCEGAIVRGNARPDVVNWLLDEMICAIVAALVPVFVTEALCEIFLPEVTVPKFKLAGENCKESCWLGEGVWELPDIFVQPAVKPTIRSANRSAVSALRKLGMRPDPTCISFDEPLIALRIALPPHTF